MFKKCFTIFLTICFVCMSTTVAAEELVNEEGKVTSISLGEEAPFSGILLDSIAGAKFIAKSKYSAIEIELRLKKDFQVQLATNSWQLIYYKCSTIL